MSVKEADVRLVRESALFDAAWYCEQYPDVKLLGIDPAEHYLWIGHKLGRQPSPDFAPEAYLKANPDVARAGVEPLTHYLRAGQNEGRRLAPSDGKSSGSEHAAAAPAARENRRGAAMPAQGAATQRAVVPVPSNAGADPAHRATGLPHYGVRMHDLIERARSRTQARPRTDEYKVIKSEFDVAYYVTQYPDIARAGRMDPVQHYINAGAKEGRDPNPFFSTKGYVSRYPEVGESGLNPFYHWLTEGRDRGLIAQEFDDFEGLSELLGIAPAKMQQKLTELRGDLIARLTTGTLGEMVAKATIYDPLIAHTWPEAWAVKIPSFHTNRTCAQVVALHRLQAAAQHRRARIVICVNRPRWGGARRMEGHIAHALADAYGSSELVVIATDAGGDMPDGKFPDGTRYVDLATITERLKNDQKQRQLVELIRALHPDAVFNVNSRLFWDALKPYGKALAASVRMYACMFCNEQTLHGYWTGYPAKRFYRAFDILAGVCTDSHALAESLQEQFCVPPAEQHRFHVLEAPVDARIPVAARPTSRGRPQIFWSGRFDQQKRIDIVYAIAERMPHVDIRMWGEAVMSNGSQLPPKPDNVVHEGVYAAFEDVPLNEAALWLYTAEWDGVPSILLEVAMTGVPIVGALAGGTGEVLRPGHAWPIADLEDIEAYVAAIEDVLANADAARARAQKLRAAMIAERTTDQYRAALQRVLETGANDA